MLLLPKNASRSFGGYMFQPRYYTSPWRLTRGVSTRLRLLLLVIITYFKSMKGQQKIHGCGSYWLLSQVAGNSNFLEAEWWWLTSWETRRQCWSLMKLITPYRPLQCRNFAAYSIRLSIPSDILCVGSSAPHFLTRPRVPISCCTIFPAKANIEEGKETMKSKHNEKDSDSLK